MNLKKKLAIFDFDNTIKQHAPGFSTGGGMAEFFPDKKIPVEFFQVWKDQGFDAFCSTLISETNKLNISREVLQNMGSNIDILHTVLGLKMSILAKRCQ